MVRVPAGHRFVEFVGAAELGQRHGAVDDRDLRPVAREPAEPARLRRGGEEHEIDALAVLAEQVRQTLQRVDGVGVAGALHVDLPGELVDAVGQGSDQPRAGDVVGRRAEPVQPVLERAERRADQFDLSDVDDAVVHLERIVVEIVQDGLQGRRRLEQLAGERDRRVPVLGDDGDDRGTDAER